MWHVADSRFYYFLTKKLVIWFFLSKQNSTWNNKCYWYEFITQNTDVGGANKETWLAGGRGLQGLMLINYWYVNRERFLSNLKLIELKTYTRKHFCTVKSPKDKVMTLVNIYLIKYLSKQSWGRLPSFIIILNCLQTSNTRGISTHSGPEYSQFRSYRPKKGLGLGYRNTVNHKYRFSDMVNKLVYEITKKSVSKTIKWFHKYNIIKDKKNEYTKEVNFTNECIRGKVILEYEEVFASGYSISTLALNDWLKGF